LSSGKYDTVIGDELAFPTIICISSEWNIKPIYIGSGTVDAYYEKPSWPWPGLLIGEYSDNLSSFQDRLASFIAKNILNPFL